MKRILMACYGGGHVRIIAPLYQRLIGKYDVKILAFTSAIEYLRSLNIPYISFSDFIDKSDTEVIKYGEMLALSLPSNSEVNHMESVAYLGASFRDLVIEYGEERALQLFSERGRSVFLPTKTLRNILSVISPDLVITTNAPRAERAALISAKSLNIKALCINDNLWISGGADVIARDHLADTICVLAEGVKDNLKKINQNANIVVTGTPVFDKLKLYDRPVRDNKVTILFADCDLPSQHPLYPGVTADPFLGGRLRAELDRLAKINNWKIIFRKHPSQNCDYSQYKNIILSESIEPLEDLLLVTDVVVTAISTVGIEGVVAGTGLVSIEGTVYGKENSYYTHGFSTPIYSEGDLEYAINKELSSDGGKKRRHVYNGVALDNIETEIDEVLWR